MSEFDVLLQEMTTSLHRIPMLVQEADAKARRSGEAMAKLGDVRLSQEIEAGLGVVRVNGHGRLISVDLDAETVRLSDTRVLGERIRQAIGAAEGKAARARALLLERLGLTD